MPGIDPSSETVDRARLEHALKEAEIIGWHARMAGTIMCEQGISAALNYIDAIAKRKNDMPKV